MTSKHDTPNSTYKVTPYKNKSVIYGGLQGAEFYTRCMILSGVYFWTTLCVTCIDYTFVILQSPIDLPGEADVTPVHSSVNNVSADSVIVTSSDRIRHDFVTLMTCIEPLQPSRYLRLFQEIPWADRAKCHSYNVVTLKRARVCVCRRMCIVICS